MCIRDRCLQATTETSHYAGRKTWIFMIFLLLLLLLWKRESFFSHRVEYKQQARITHICSLQTLVPTGNWTRVFSVILSRISIFVSKKHSRSILRKMLLECFFDTKILMRERITENTRVQFPVGTKVWSEQMCVIRACCLYSTRWEKKDSLFHKSNKSNKNIIKIQVFRPA